MSPPRSEEAVADAGHTRTADSEGTCSSAIVAEDEEHRKFLRLQERAGRAGHALLAVASGFLLVRHSGSSHHSSSLDAIATLLSAREAAE